MKSATLSCKLSTLLTMGLLTLCVVASPIVGQKIQGFNPGNGKEPSRLSSLVTLDSALNSSSENSGSAGTLSLLGKNVNLYIDPYDQDEPTIALNPMNPSHLVAGSHDRSTTKPEGTFAWYIVYRSLDGGRTWTGRHIPREGPLSTFIVTGDPGLDFDSFGNVYFSGVCYEENMSRISVWAAKSADGGFTIGTPIMLDWGVGEMGDPFFEANDKPWIAVDKRTIGTGAGNVYVVWTSYVDKNGDGSKDSYHILISRSTDGGATFTNPIQVSDAGNWADQFSQVSVGSSGEVYFSWFNWNHPVPGMARILFDKSTDYGASFGTDVVVQSLREIKNLGYVYRTPSTISMAVDASEGARDGYVYIAYPIDPTSPSDCSDMMFTRSIDGGTTWSLPVRLNDDVPSNDQFFPALAVNPSGSVKAAWYDRRLDSDNRLIDVFYTESDDGGSSFTTNVRVSDVSFDPEYAFIGDYIDMDASQTQVYAIWTDRRNGNNDIYTLRTADEHDLSIAFVTPSKTAVCQGYNLNISITFANVGTQPETFNLTAFANASVIAAFKDLFLANGSSATIVIEWNTAGFALSNYTVSVYAWPVFGETDTADNLLACYVAVAHMGDVNGDGRVDIQDLARVSGAFGSVRINDRNDLRYWQYWHPTPCKYCPHTPNADINNDGIIDIQDLARTSANFGWHR